MKKLAFLFFILLTACNSDKKSDYTSVDQNINIEKSSFVGSATCKSCHQQEFEQWQGSHHEQAMKIADSTSVLASFNTTTFIHKDVKSTFYKKEGVYYVNTEGPTGEHQDYPIAYVFGVFPLQQYLIKFPNGAFQCLSTAWDSREDKWFHLQPDLDIKHDEWLHWTGGSMNWNTMCADCHSTNVKKNFEVKTNTYNTTFDEINVSCESCHGPSSQHVSFYKNPIQGKTPPALYMDKGMDSKEVVEKCARCHSRRTQFTNYFDYEEHYLDHYLPSILSENLYHLDGQIKDEVYVYGSFVQSKMYHNGVSCKDCHDVHTLKLKKQGNDLCLSCHEPQYNTQAHYFHQPDSEGSQCINCHMPGKLYMGNDFRRDHSFRIPRPDQTVKYGVPNSCNTCHTDKTAEWASKAIVNHFGEDRKYHFSDDLLAGYNGNQSAYEAILSNGNIPAIVRATAMDNYSDGPLSEEQLFAITRYLNDTSAIIRNQTIIALEKFGNDGYKSDVIPLLNDSLRGVRIAAARYFNMLGKDEISNHDAFKKADQEYHEMLALNADFASGQHQIALNEQSKGNIDLAIKAYKRSIEIDNYYNQSRMNLAMLYYQQGKVTEAEQLYLKVIDQEPEFGHSYYMLGLLYNEIGETENSLKYLKLATEKKPANQNAFYNYAIKLQEQKDFKASLALLKKAVNLFPNNERLLYVKLVAEANMNLMDEARATCLQLIAIAPMNNDYKLLLNRLNQ